MLDDYLIWLKKKEMSVLPLYLSDCPSRISKHRYFLRTPLPHAPHKKNIQPETHTMKQTTAASRTLLFYAALLSYSPAAAFSFNKLRHHQRSSIHLHSTSSVRTTFDLEDLDAVSSTPPFNSRWATNALLFSSWNDGVAPNLVAKSFLRFSIVNKLLQDHVSEKENGLETSVKFSPCNGPDVNELNNLEIADTMSESGKEFTFETFDSEVTNDVDSWAKETLQHVSTGANEVTVKLLYIPTAMYALNPQSSNTPGKQRQRARADGKKRRTQVLNLLKTLLSTESSDNLCFQTITLDLDDDSLKQPEGPDNSQFPHNGKEAFTTWNPTVIYVEGGNTFWLQHCIDKGEYSQLIIDACTGNSGAVYCGKSAGAIVAGDDMSTATWKGWDDPSVVPNRETYDDWIGTKGFTFSGSVSYFPHMSDDWIEMVHEKVEKQESDKTTCCLREEEVCCITGGSKQTFVVSAAVPEC